MPEDTNWFGELIERLRKMTPEDCERARSEIEKKCKEEGKHKPVPWMDTNTQLDSREMYEPLMITEACPNCNGIYSRPATREEIEEYNSYLKSLKIPMAI